MKICLVGAELFHADSQINRYDKANKLIAAFHHSANTPKNGEPGNQQ